MISIDDAPYTYEYEDYYKILPAINNWVMIIKEELIKVS